MKKIVYQQFRGRPKKHYPPFPSAYCTDYISSRLAEKQYGMRLNAAYAYDQEKLYSMVEGGRRRQKFDKMLLKKFLKNPSHLGGLIRWSEKRINSLKNYIEGNLPKNNLKLLSDEQIIKRYKKYVSLYRLFHLKNTPPWWLGAEEAEKELKKYLKSRKYGRSDLAFNILASGSEYPTESFLEEMSLLDICIWLQKIEIKKIGLIKNMPSSVRRLFRKHIKNFSSIPFGYNTGVVWGEKHFLREIKAVFRKKESLKEIKKRKLSSIQNQIEEREKFETDNKIPTKIIILARTLRQLAYLQDLKKTAQTRSHPHLVNRVYPEIARRTGVKKKYFGYLSHFDLERILKQGKVLPEQKKEFEERLKTCVVIMKNLSYMWLYNKEAIKFLTDAGVINIEGYSKKEFKGQIASRGYAKGKVRVCLQSTKIKKVKLGDILVASMTTPDFVPAMKKAAAIITDEGGITSHAAIVSRELGIPCIIGTKIATQVLKDGDLVEVDADRGIVKILKKVSN